MLELELPKGNLFRDTESVTEVKNIIEIRKLA
jgi:hypothetical protein